MADCAGVGYTGGALIFGGLPSVIAVMHFRTKISKTVLFGAAFILTRPLGLVVGDFLYKPVSYGGLALSRFGASGTLFVLILQEIGISFPKSSKVSTLNSA